MKICLLNIATNKYISFVNQLHKSVHQYFLTNHDVHTLLFTNHNIEDSSNLKVSTIDHEPWPAPTLKRFHYFLQERDFISQFDYCFYMDVDMQIVDVVGEEIFGDLVATHHPAPWNKPNNQSQFTYERNPLSTAYIAPEEGKMYYAGGFNGGKPEHFLKMAEVIKANVEKDTSNGITAVWCDESHINKYLIDTPPTVELTPSYCFPLNWHVPYPPKIIALNKNHAEMRS